MSGLHYPKDHPIAQRALAQQARKVAAGIITENGLTQVLIEEAERRESPEDKPHKYHAQKTVVDGITFDSRKEARRYGELKALEKAAEIINLELQPRYELIPKQKGERACVYIGDFRYKTWGDEIVVEDCKGMKTPVYRIKKKLMLHVHGIRIIEI